MAAIVLFISLLEVQAPANKLREWGGERSKIIITSNKMSVCSKGSRLPLKLYTWLAPHLPGKVLYLLYIHYPPLENLPLEKNDLKKIFYRGYEGIRQWPIN